MKKKKKENRKKKKEKIISKLHSRFDFSFLFYTTLFFFFFLFKRKQIFRVLSLKTIFLQTFSKDLKKKRKGIFLIFKAYFYLKKKKEREREKEKGIKKESFSM